MANKGVAAMHVFFEIKQMFPTLSEDFIRDYIHLWSENREKCIKILEKESANQHCCNPYPIKLPQHSLQVHRNGTPKPHTITNSTCDILPLPVNCNHPKALKVEDNSTPIQKSEKVVLLNSYKNKPDVYVSSTTIHLSNPPKKDTRLPPPKSSIPSHQETLRPFHRLYNTTLPPQHNHHTVKLSFTPNSLNNQHKIKMCSNSLSATTSQHSHKGQHITSVNLKYRQSPRHQATLVQTSSPKKSTDVFKSGLQIAFTPEKSKQQSNFIVIPHNVAYQQPPCGILTRTWQGTALSPNVNTTSHRNGNIAEVCRPDQAIANWTRGEAKMYPEPQDKILDCQSQKVKVVSTSKAHSQSHVQAVIHHQRLRIEVLRKAMEKKGKEFIQLLRDIKQLECELNPHQVTSMLKLSDDTSKLKHECNTLLKKLSNMTEES